MQDVQLKRLTALILLNAFCFTIAMTLGLLLVFVIQLIEAGNSAALMQFSYWSALFGLSGYLLTLIPLACLFPSVLMVAYGEAMKIKTPVYYLLWSLVPPSIFLSRLQSFSRDGTLLVLAIYISALIGGLTYWAFFKRKTA